MPDGYRHRNIHQFTSRARKRGGAKIERLNDVQPEEAENIVAVPAESIGVKVEYHSKNELLLTFRDKSQLLVKLPPIKQGGMKDIEYAALATTKLALNLAFIERTGPDQVGFTTSQESEINNLPGNRENDPEAALTWACSTLIGMKNGLTGKRGRTMREVAEMWVNSNQIITAGLNLGSINKFQKENAIKMLENVLIDHCPGNSQNRSKKKVEDW